MSTGTDDADAWTVARLLAWTQEFLERKGLAAPRLCAEILLAHSMQCERLRLFTQHDAIPGPAVRDTFRMLVQQAATGRPIAYLTGTKEFFSLTFEVGPDVLIPRPETEILVERTIRLARQTPDTPGPILDLGTGSGCIAVCLARHLPAAQVGASDVSPLALDIARRNAQRHGVADRIDCRAGDLFAPWQTPDGQPQVFNIIVTNPPYVADDDPALETSVREFEPHQALFGGPDGLWVIRRILADAPRHLAAGGHLLLEIAYNQADAVRALLQDAVWQNISTYRDLAGHERVLHVQRSANTQVQVA